MDMDGTITPTPNKAHGHFLPLNQTACHAPLATWLRRGGNLAVVSTAGRRMWRQVHEDLKPAMTRPSLGATSPGRLVMSGFSGAALFASDPATGELVEDPEYRRSAVPDGTCPTTPQMLELVGVGCSMIRTFLLAAAKDATLLPALSRKYHAPYEKLLAGLREHGEEAFFGKVLTREAMLKHGAFLDATNDALVDVQTIPGSDPVAAAQVTVLGIPMARFGEFFTPELVATLENAGLHVKSQPNSVCIVRAGVDKATFVRWMCQHGHRYSATGAPFSLRHAIAFGDNPAVVDKPLTIFPDMAFVSLAPDAATTPKASHVVHGGGEEEGCARFLRHLLATHEDIGGTGSAVDADTEQSWWEAFCEVGPNTSGDVSLPKVDALASTAAIGATPVAPA